MTSSSQLSLREAKISLSRYEKALPPLYRQLHQHVEIIRTAKRQANVRALNREQTAASKTFKSLKRYLQDVDELEARVSLTEIPRFKAIADPLRSAAYERIVEFVELDAQLDDQPAELPITPSSPEPPFSGSTVSASSGGAGGLVEEAVRPSTSDITEEEASHPELAALQQLKRTEEDAKELEAVESSWRNLQQDLQDVAEMMATMSKLVKEQGERVDSIEENVQAADLQTKQGLLEIIKARRAKFASMPIAGALLGGLIAGPLGMLAGFKAAGVASALVGSYVGYKGSSYMRDSVDKEVLEAPAMAAFTDDEEEEEEGEFQQFGEGEISESERYRPYKK